MKTIAIILLVSTLNIFTGCGSDFHPRALDIHRSISSSKIANTGLLIGNSKMEKGDREPLDITFGTSIGYKANFNPINTYFGLYYDAPTMLGIATGVILNKFSILGGATLTSPFVSSSFLFTENFGAEINFQLKNRYTLYSTNGIFMDRFTKHNYNEINMAFSYKFSDFNLFSEFGTIIASNPYPIFKIGFSGVKN